MPKYAGNIIRRQMVIAFLATDKMSRADIAILSCSGGSRGGA